MGSKTAPSYNPKVPCECGRGMKCKVAASCHTCAVERRGTKHHATEKVSNESLRASLNSDTSTDWLRKPLRANA